MASNTLTNGIKQQDTRASSDGPAQRAYDNATVLDAAVGDINSIIRVVKDADQIDYALSYVNDNDIVVALEANQRYDFTLIAIAKNTVALGAGDPISLKWSVPSGTTMKWQNSPGNTSPRTAAQSVVLSLTGSFQEDIFLVFGTIDTAGTAGNLQLQWANDGGGYTTYQLGLLAGTALTVRKVS